MNALRGAPFPLSKEKIEQALLAAVIDPRRRAETLDLAAALKTAQAGSSVDREINYLNSDREPPAVPDNFPIINELRL